MTQYIIFIALILFQAGICFVFKHNYFFQKIFSCYHVKKGIYPLWENSFEGKEMNFLLLANIFLIEITLLGFIGTIFARLFIYMSVFYMISIPKAVSLLPKRNARALCITVILLMTVIYQNVIIRYRPDWTAVIPYETYLSNPSNIRTKITMNSAEFL